jgi:hypothetical protein
MYTLNLRENFHFVQSKWYTIIVFEKYSEVSFNDTV